MADIPPSSNRRDFLTGRAARDQLEAAGARIADRLVESADNQTVPVSHDTVRLETSAMACAWSVVMNPGPPKQVMTASSALDVVHRIEDQLTVYRDHSEVIQINRQAAKAPVAVEPKLFSLLIACRQWSESTGGAFDPTSGPLINLWRASRREGRIPTRDEIDCTLRSVGMHHVLFDKKSATVQFPSTGYAFDFGGVGKGYAIDRAAEHLRQQDVSDFLLHGGHSSMYAAGDHAGQGGWPVGLRNPLFTEQRLATVLLHNEGMSTSGSNIQFFRHQGQRYGHILDPRTGWPTHSPEGAGQGGDPSGSLLSVTVLAATAAEADALSTAFYVMGLEKASDYCHNHPEVSAILIPSPNRGRTLKPVVCNLPEDRLFLEAPQVQDPWSDVGKGADSPQSTMDPDQPTTDHP